MNTPDMPDFESNPYPDKSTGVDTPNLLVRWQDNRLGKWSKLKFVSLGKTGEASLTRRIGPMGVYRSRQFELVVTDSVIFTLSAIEDRNGVLE